MSALTGSIDGFNGRGIFGWARHDNASSDVEVDIHLNGVRVARGVRAERFRQDLARGGSNGQCGFAWELPLDATFGNEAQVAIVSTESGERIAERTFRAPYSDTPWRGRIIGASKGKLTGWVKHNGSSLPVTVDVYMDDALIASKVACDVPVPELASVTGNDGRFGFDVAAVPVQPTADTVTVTIHDSIDGSVIFSRTLDAEPLKNSYRGHLEVTESALIRGWCVNENWPSDTFEVDILLDGHLYLSTVNKLSRRDLLRAQLSTGLGGVSFVNPFHQLLVDGEQHTLSLRYPDHTTSREYVIATRARHTQGMLATSEAHTTRGVTVIVPIYNAADDVEVCIERFLRFTPEFATLLLIDDCSTDNRIRDILASYRDNSRVSILTNDENLGFTRTVNKGISAAGDDDVILLNSDARVTPGWLEGMLAASQAEPRVSTVTAMSDRAGAFSAPAIGNDNQLPGGVDEIAYARAFRRRALGLYPRVPTGNGFCMWVSRRCLDEVGGLDSDAFPRGYGEENDFCMRAGRAGWVHVIDDRTYVFHDRSKSFGESKSELLSSGRNVIDTRYPEYKYAIRTFRSSPQIALARNRAALAMVDASAAMPPLPRILFVTSTTTGGTPQTNADLMNALNGSVETWTLRCDSRELTLSRYVEGVTHVVRRHELLERIEPITHYSQEYDAVVASWIREYDFDIVHIRHLLWHSLSLPRTAKRLGKKVVCSFHDFYALSPNLKLIDDSGIYLGDNYSDPGSPYRDSGWAREPLPAPTGAWLNWWQERFWDALKWCDEFVTTSVSARDLILSSFTKMDADVFNIIEHGRDFEEFRSTAHRPRHGEPLRILVPGNINAAKGSEILRGISECDALGQIEWHILGATKEPIESDGSRVIYHGAYKREDFGDLVAKIAPHAGAVLSIWDETYCHTLTEMWSMGIPSFVLDFPNVSQRVSRFSAGWVLEGLDGGSLLTQITECLFSPTKRESAIRGVLDWQSGWGLSWTTTQMSLRYLDIYRRLLVEQNADQSDNNLRVGVLVPPDPEDKRARASSFTGICERTRNSIERPVDYIKLTPDGALASVQQGLLDALVVNQSSVPVTAVSELLAKLAGSSIPLINELDCELTASNEWPEAGRKYAARASTVKRLLDNSSALLVPTAALRDRFSPLDIPIEILPAVLNNRLWYPQPISRRLDGTLRALYSCTRAHTSELESILPALDRLSASVPKFELILAGDVPKPQLEKLCEDRPWISSVESPSSVTQYSQFVTWLRGLSTRVDFAIAPLVDERLYGRNSDKRLLEYIGLGLPTVASANGPYLSTDIPGVTTVDNSIDAWADALRAMAEEIQASGLRIDGAAWLVENRMLGHAQERLDDFITTVARNPPPDTPAQQIVTAGSV